MAEIKSVTKVAYFTLVILGFLVMLFFPLPTFAAAGCCSGHGGVAKCNTTTGYQMCKDGTQSPTCTCKKVQQKGCCSGHGGVSGCDKTSGYQTCKDGTTSPTCKCG